MGTFFSVSDHIMSIKQLFEMDLDSIFENLLEGLEENVRLDEKRIIVNSILPIHKYKLLQRFLSEEEPLSETILVNCLSIFLDQRTKFFKFNRHTSDQSTIKSILEIITRYATNIETIDFRRLRIFPENKEQFKTFLKKSSQLKFRPA